jgi:hypothetical protein
MSDHHGSVTEVQRRSGAGVQGMGMATRFDARCSCGWSAEGATWSRAADSLLAHQERVEAEVEEVDGV